jgi:hypothetical protein
LFDIQILDIRSIVHTGHIVCADLATTAAAHRSQASLLIPQGQAEAAEIRAPCFMVQWSARLVCWRKAVFCERASSDKTFAVGVQVEGAGAEA